MSTAQSQPNSVRSPMCLLQMTSRKRYLRYCVRDLLKINLNDTTVPL